METEKATAQKHSVRFEKGSTIRMWGDLSWHLENETHIYIGAFIVSTESFENLTYKQIKDLLEKGRIRRAIERLEKK